MPGDIASSKDGQSIARFASSNPVFVCIISYTETSEIPGITIAGANPELIKYTSPADAEFLYYGRCKCIDGVPATPDGKPTPALITRTALSAGNIPAFVVDSGAKIKPSVPVISFGLEPGKNITKEAAMTVSAARRAFEHGEIVGRELARSSDLVIVGESIPGGTTTALAVLTALGVQAEFKVSSSMPDNPHTLKNRVVRIATERSGIKPGGVMAPFDAIALLGDPMIPSAAGIASGAQKAGSRVMLAGGTQMTAVLIFMKDLGVPLANTCIGTTSYLVRDTASDIVGLVNEIAPSVPVLSCDLHLGESSKPGLRAFAEGFVKEGVGAGGTSLAAMQKSRITGKKLLKEIEKRYELNIEAKVKKRTFTT